MVGKAELAERIAGHGGTRAQAAAVLDAVLAEVTAALAAGERVTLTGFGTFEPATRAARTQRNPRTGEPMAVAASVSARFRPGATLRSALVGAPPAMVSTAPAGAVTGDGVSAADRRQVADAGAARSKPTATRRARSTSEPTVAASTKATPQEVTATSNPAAESKPTKKSKQAPPSKSKSKSKQAPKTKQASKSTSSAKPKAATGRKGKKKA